MTPMQAAAFVIAQAECAAAELGGMKAQNDADKLARQYPTYNASDFNAIPNKYGIHHNAVLTLFQQAQE